MNEDKAKALSIKNAKSFLEELRFVIDDIEERIDSPEVQMQINGVIHAGAISECLKQYPDHVKAIFENLEKQQASFNERAS